MKNPCEGCLIEAVCLEYCDNSRDAMRKLWIRIPRDEKTFLLLEGKRGTKPISWWFKKIIKILKKGN